MLNPRNRRLYLITKKLKREDIRILETLDIVIDNDKSDKECHDKITKNTI